MDKPPEIIEGTFRVVGEEPKREPFFGPGASVGNVLCALMGGAMVTSFAPESEKPASLAVKLLNWGILLVIAIGLIQMRA